MIKSKIALVVASCLIIAAPAAVADADNSDVQQARDRAKEVERLRQRDQEYERERQDQVREDRRKLKEIKEDARERAENEEGLGNDLEEDGVDGRK